MPPFASSTWSWRLDGSSTGRSTTSGTKMLATCETESSARREPHEQAHHIGPRSGEEHRPTPSGRPKPMSMGARRPWELAQRPWATSATSRCSISLNGRRTAP